MIKCKFLVVILNYMSAKDSIDAAKSIIRHEIEGKYHICIADNASPDISQMELLLNTKLSNTTVLSLDKNNGYAKGNNIAIKKMRDFLQFDYVVIMNPDVIIFENNTILNLINRIDSIDNPKVVGGQPLVWNYFYDDKPRFQTNMTKVQSYKDIVIASFALNRYIYKKKWEQLVFYQERPYISELIYNVPCGAFFIIKDSVFSEIGFFDEGTFLYNEETILGYKLYERNYQLLLMPDYMVKHMHLLTKKSKYSRTIAQLKYEKQGKKLYLSKYLKVGKIRILFVMFLLNCDYFIRKFYSLFVSSVGLNIGSRERKTDE